MIFDVARAAAHYGVDVVELERTQDFSPAWGDPERIYVAQIEDGMSLPFYVGGLTSGEAGRPLRVGFHGAKLGITNESFMFAPVGQSQASGDPFVLFDDPTLYLDPEFRLCWYLGTPTCDPQDAMSQIARTLRQLVAPKVVFTMGSSGGGFAAIQMAQRLDNAVAVAVAPQTDVFRYHIHEHLGMLLQRHWGGLSQSRINTDFGSRFRLADRLTESTAEAVVIRYLQNSGDLQHVRNHQRPLFWELGYSEDRIDASQFGLYLTTLYVSEGHVNTPVEYWEAELKMGARLLKRLPSKQAVDPWRRRANLRLQPRFDAAAST